MFTEMEWNGICLVSVQLLHLCPQSCHRKVKTAAIVLVALDC